MFLASRFVVKDELSRLRSISSITSCINCSSTPLMSTKLGSNGDFLNSSWILFLFSSKELIYDLLIEVTENIRNEFLDKLALEKPGSAISKAQDEVMKFVREKEGKGEFVLSPNSFETYV